MAEPTATTRRTFLGSLIAAVPALGAIASLAGIDTVVASATIKLYDKPCGFLLQRLASGRTRAFFAGRPMKKIPKSIRYDTYDILNNDAFASVGFRWIDNMTIEIEHFKIITPTAGDPWASHNLES